MFGRKFILFNVLHMTGCFIATAVTLHILGGKNFIEYSLFEKALRGSIALIYFIGAAYFVAFFVLRYFSKYIDVNILGKILIYLSPLWLILSAFLYTRLFP